MAKKNFNDKERKKIIAEYVQGSSYASLGKKYGVHASTIMRICKKDEETQSLANDKKEQNTIEMIAFMDNRKDKAQIVIDMILDNLCNKEVISKASARDQSIILGVIVDKFMMGAGDKENHVKISNAENVLVKIRETAIKQVKDES